jgi:hypothetical protein
MWAPVQVNNLVLLQTYIFQNFVQLLFSLGGEKPTICEHLHSKRYVDSRIET